MDFKKTKYRQKITIIELLKTKNKCIHTFDSQGS